MGSTIDGNIGHWKYKALWGRYIFYKVKFSALCTYSGFCEYGHGHPKVAQSMTTTFFKTHIGTLCIENLFRC